MAQGFQPTTEQKTTPVASYTQSDLATKLGRSVTAIKGYLGKIEKIWVWEKDQFKHPDGRYTELCLSRLREWQDVLRNPETITFSQFQARVWAENNFNPEPETPLKVSGFTPESAGFQAETETVEYVRVEIFNPETANEIRMECEEETAIARQELSSGMQLFGQQLEVAGDVIGAQLGRQLANRMVRSMQATLAGEMSAVVQDFSGK